MHTEPATQTDTPPQDTGVAVVTLSPDGTPPTPDFQNWEGNADRGDEAVDPAVDASRTGILAQINESFQKLNDLINSPAEVALALVQRALESPEGRAYIAEYLANNIDFRKRMTQEPEAPPQDFSNVVVTLSHTLDGPDYTYARLFDENDPVNPGTLAIYHPNGTSFQEHRFVPEIEEKVLNAIEDTKFDVKSGAIFYVRISDSKVEAQLKAQAEAEAAAEAANDA